jgi:hypothetical protein
LFGKDKHLRYLCQDETRLGLHTITGRLLTLKGVKPHGPTQWRRDNFYLYGVVEPLTGDSYFYEYSHLDSCCFQLFINQVSQRFAGSIVMLQMDRGRFHLSRQLDWPENLIPLCQPAHCPELNPIERLWEYVKAQLRWENCHSLDELRQQVYAILAQMMPTVITSLTSWDFIRTAINSYS